MDADELRRRTKKFGLDVIKLVDSLPSTQTGRVIENQLLRSALSVGANYRAACRGRSKADFISKIGITIEEADESQHWLEMLTDAGLVAREKIQPLAKGVMMKGRALRELILAETPDPAAVRQASAELGNAIADAAVQASILAQEARSILTPEQVNKLKELRQRRQKTFDETLRAWGERSDGF